jgi:hypothetical protein
LFERREELLVAKRSARMFVGTQSFDILLPNHPGEEPAPGWRPFEQGSDTNERIVPATHMGSSAAPPITARRVYQPSTHWVELDVARGGQQVWFIEHERGEPPLLQMAPPPLSEVDHAGVTPMHLADRATKAVG